MLKTCKRFKTAENELQSSFFHVVEPDPLADIDAGLDDIFDK